MSTTKKRKSAKETRVLVASIITAAAIIAGSTFAWFSSSDEVTNRLSSTADYGVTIAEDFTPPENWLPGQEIDKNVAVVNTGNVDAFVRTWLEGEMNLYTEKTSATSVEAFGDLTLTDTADPDLIAIGLTKYTEVEGKRVYFKQLSTEETLNPLNSAIADNVDDESNDNTYSEVKSVQAGGWLAYASEGAAFTFTPNQAMQLTDPDGEIAAFDIGEEVSSGALLDTWSEGKGVAIDSDTFVPTESGVYIFRRLINATASEEEADGFEYEYSGYYFDGENYFALQYKTEVGEGDEKALVNTSANSDYVLDPSYITTVYTDGEEDSISSVDHIELNDLMMFEAEQLILTNADLTWSYYPKDAEGIEHTVISQMYTNETLNVTIYIYQGAQYTDPKCTEDSLVEVQYQGLSEANGWTSTSHTETWTEEADGAVEVPTLKVAYTNPYTKAPIEIFIELGETVDTDEAEGWTMLTKTDDDKEYYTFYYNNDLEEGDTTARLVDNVKLSEKTVKEAYLAFDFDLNVKMDSIQIAINTEGQEDFDSVKDGWTTSNAFVTAASAEEEVGAPEIETITWEAADENP